MTLSRSQSFGIDGVWVDRNKRQRKELTGIEDLLSSMNSSGQINPIVITKEGELVAGERRLTAAKLGGWTNIEVRFVEDLTPSELMILELDENIKRHQLSWPDECMAILTYHEARANDNAEWGQPDTARELNVSVQEINSKMNVARELRAGNQRVLDAPKYSTARNVTIRTQERAEQSAVAAAVLLLNPGAVKVAPEVPLLNEDFHIWALNYSGEKFNFLHCDFPYGVNADKHDQGQAAEMGGYEDSFAVYEGLLDTLGFMMDKIVADSAHMMFWFSMDYYQLTKDKLTSMGWKVNSFPLMWYKNDNTGILPDPQRGPRRSYETAFLCSRGDRKITARGAVSNTCAWPGRDKSIHMSEKPVGMLKHFMGMLVDEYSRVLDPTAGSANALKAASALGARQVLGLERDIEFFERAKEHYFDD